MKKAIFCWSGGKDSAYALGKILSDGEYQVSYLLTTINGQFQRISMHGVREILLEQQAEAIGIPLLKAYVYEGSYEEYEREMEQTLLRARAEGISQVIFGDIFLEDLRRYREQQVQKVGLQAVFPLWKRDTSELINDFIAQGFKTVTCCISDAYLDASWVGRELDQQFVADLPADVDPCGENGEYHTFCYYAPYVKRRIAFSCGEKIYTPLVIKTTDQVCSSNEQTQGFWFCDLVPDAVDTGVLKPEVLTPESTRR